MLPIFYAHSENNKGKKHELSDHLLHTAKLASSYSPQDSLQQLFFLAGLLHDIGKFQDGFQRYLFEGGKKTPHAGIGAYIARRNLKRLLPLPFVISGHHAGLTNAEDLKTAIDDYGADEDKAEELIAKFEASGFEWENLAEQRLPSDRLVLECLTRFLFSALTDADWLDTEHHFNQEQTEARKRENLAEGDLCVRLVEQLEERFREFPVEGRINELRAKARIESASFAERPTGFYSLQLPTGLGKTWTSVYWALLHARYNHLRRIIIVLPYINIIDQTAKVLKSVFGDDAVLEHHSGVADETQDDDRYDESAVGEDKDFARKLACENWDAPIIVTTSVQFFESLFSNKPFKCRKNHNIAESVVIFDEVQTLPKEYAEPIMVMLKNINSLARTSFLFCTATQPAFARRENFDGIENIQPIISSPKEYFRETKRVEYELLEDLDEVPLTRIVAELVKENDSFMVVVNTKTIARELFKAIREVNGYHAFYHLSTAMCPHHRKKTIDAITEDLRNMKRIGVVSTQLVEAGVDLDFPCVYRAMAPMDSIIQAAGRCNRNGRMKTGKVVLFNLENHRMPDKTYAACADFAATLIREDPEILHSHSSFERYYEEVSSLFVNADRYKITDKRRRFDFKEVSESFRFIDEPTTPMVIEGYPEGASLLEEIIKLIDVEKVSGRKIISRDHYRRLQQFSVQVYPNFIKVFGSQIISLNEIVTVYTGNYDNDCGLSPKDVETVF